MDLGAKFCRKYHRCVAARDWSDGHQILSDGRYGVDEETRGGGEMKGAAKMQRWEVELAGKLFVSSACGDA